MKYNFMDCKEGTMLDNFYPEGWDLKKIHKIMGVSGVEAYLKPEKWWNKDFVTEKALMRNDWFIKLGFRMALEIKKAKEEGKKIALLLPIAPISMYYWCVKFIKEWKLSCDHVYGFSLCDFADANGNEGGFDQETLEQNFYGPLGEYAVPLKQRNYASEKNLPQYETKLDKIHEEGGRIVLVYSLGRSTSVGFWEPQWAKDFKSEKEFLSTPYRLGGGLHPMTILEYTMNVFKGNFAACPARANAVGFGIIKKVDLAIGGAWADIAFNQRWQTLGAWLELHYGPDMWVPSSYLSTIPGTFFTTVQHADLDVGTNPYWLPFANEIK